MKPDVEYEVPVKDWVEFTREIVMLDREVTKDDFRRIIKDEWQTTQDTIERVDKLENTSKWLTYSQLIQGLLIVFLLVKELLK